jgi:hypothetical protein
MLSFSLFRSGELFEEILDLTFDLDLLFVHQTKPRDEQHDVLSACVDHSGSNVKIFSRESLAYLLWCPASNPVTLQ